MKNDNLTCEEWLKYFLLSCEEDAIAVSEIKAAAEQGGYTKKELRAAKNRLGIISTNNGCAGRVADAWYWSLPEVQV